MDNIVTNEETLRKFRNAQQSEDAPNIVVDEEKVKKFRALQGKKQSEVVDQVEETDIPEGSTVGDFIRTGRALAQSVPAEIGAGLYGLGTLLGTFDVKRSVESIEAARDYLGYVPETEGAQENLRAIGEVVAPIGQALETVSDNAAGFTYKYTGSPELAGVAGALPLVALELAGIKGIGAGTKRLTELDVRKTQKEMLKDPELRYSGAVAEVKLDKFGSLVEDKIGKKLVSNGLPENQVSVLTNSNKPTKTLMKNMVTQFEKSKGNDVTAMTSKTTEFIGKSIQNRLVSLNSLRAGLGKRLDSLVNSDVGKKQIDISSSLEGLNSLLLAENIRPVLRNGKLYLPKNWEKDTSFDLKTMQGVKKAVEDAYSVIGMGTEAGKTTVKEAHKIKKNLDLLIDASKLSGSGVPDQTIRQIANVRKGVNLKLREVGEYGAINDDLSTVISAMAPFEKHLKPGQKWENARVADVVGSSMKSLAEESTTAVDLANDLTDLENKMRTLNINFGDDPRALLVFRKTLLDNFNIDPQALLFASGRASKDALLGFTTSAAVGNTFGAAHDATKLMKAGMTKRKAKKIAQQNKENLNLIKAGLSQ
jgi:hypothetical protein